MTRQKRKERPPRVRGRRHHIRSRGLQLERLEDRRLLALDTQLIADINSLPIPSGYSPANFVQVGNQVYFTAISATTGTELWKSDGTAAGTALVKDIRVGKESASPRYLTNVNGTLFFRANDGTHGEELWKSDGTAGGTVLVKDIRAGSGHAYPSFLTNVNGTLSFRANDGTSGEELWKSNGTAGGTVLVKDIRAGSGGASPRQFAHVQGTLFFQPNEGTSGYELWKSDGTAAGTVPVKDTIAATGHASPRYLTGVNGTLPEDPTSLQIAFSEPLIGGRTAANYRLQSLGPDGLLGTADDAAVPLWARYDSTLVTLRFAPLPEGVYRLTVRDELTDVVGNALDGDGDGTPGGDWVWEFVSGVQHTTLTSAGGELVRLAVSAGHFPLLSYLDGVVAQPHRQRHDLLEFRTQS